MTLNEIEVLLQNAVGYIDRIYEHWTGCDGEVVNLPDYTVVIDRTGGYHVMHEDFTERLAHTWHRNSRSIGIAMACCKDAICYYDHPDGIDLGSEPPTAAQIEAMAMLTAKAEEILGLTADDVYTHAEIAEIDGYGVSSGEPDMRWDLLYLPDYSNGGVLVPGGDLIRGKAEFYKNQEG